MNYIKNIFNDSKELTHKYIILSIIHVVFLLVAKIKVSMISVTSLLSILLPMAYFIYIRTSSGKRNFNILNKIVSILLIVSVAYNCYLFIFRVLPNLGMLLDSIYMIVSYGITILSCVYWILVFFVPEYKKVNIFKKPDVNNNIYIVLVVLYAFYFILFLVQYVKYGYYIENIVLLALNMAFCILESILQIRYIYLYQKFKEGRI